jgi:hypothetical protein
MEIGSSPDQDLDCTSRNEAQIFLNPISFLIMQMEVCCFPFIDKETNGSYLFANKLNGLAHLRRLDVTETILKIRRDSSATVYTTSTGI